MVDHIRKVQAQGCDEEASRLTQILIRDLQSGLGTLGCEKLDANLLATGKIDTSPED